MAGLDSWQNWDRNPGYFCVLIVLLGLLSRPWRKLPSHSLLPPPFTQAPERFSLEKPVLLNVLVFGWKDRNLMENRIFDNFVQLLGNYLENIDLDTVEQGAEERADQRKS